MKYTMENTYPVDELGHAIIPDGEPIPVKIGIFKRPSYMPGNKKPTDADVFQLNGDKSLPPLWWNYDKNGINSALYMLKTVKEFAATTSSEMANNLFLRAAL